ncbi:MAG TPA: glycosyltransferase family 2 protein [Leeuwenhoekiella sp.]|nr:glycosyltransferase family 2 protein [Leeuwenhoekiella sp.]
MRIGKNPQKFQFVKENKYNHLILIPIYIPHNKGYYLESFEILQYCLESLIKTIHSKTFIAVVNNGSCTEVIQYLNNLLNDKLIHEAIHTFNIGKINSIIKGLAGHDFDLVTISDADIFFQNNWQKETVKVFNEFPKTGVVGIIPQLKMFSYCCENILFDKFWSNHLKFVNVLNPKGIKHFCRSIGWDDSYNKNYLKKHLIIESKNGFRALLGTGHAVSTYRFEIFKKINFKTNDYKLGGEIELDQSSLKFDTWRLTTEDNYAYHMGNTKEVWMHKEIRNLNTSSKDTLKVNYVYKLERKKLAYFFKYRIFRKILKNPYIYRFLLKKKGLPIQFIKHF